MKPNISLAKSFVLLGLTVAVLAWVGWLAISWFSKLNPGVAGAIVTAAAGFTGLIYAQWHSKKKEISEGHRPEKIRVFNLYLDIVDHFMEEGRKDVDNEVELTDELQKQFFELNRGLTLWASPGVIRAWLEFRRRSVTGDPSIILYASDVLQEMRKDLGHSNIGLKRGDVMRLSLKDPDDLVH